MSQSDVNALDQGLLENIRLSASIAKVIVLVGNRQYDRFVLKNTSDEISVVHLGGLLWSALRPVEALWCYDPANEIPILYNRREGFTVNGGLPSEKPTIKKQTHEATAPIESSSESLSDCDKLIKKQDILPAFINMAADDANLSGQMVLLLDAGLLFEDSAHPRDTEHALLRAIELFSRSTETGKLLVLRVARLTAIPTVLTSSPAVRVVSLPMTGRDERMAYALLRCKDLAAQCGLEPRLLASILSNVSDGWRLEDLEGLIRNSLQQGIKTPTELEATARAYRLGCARSPWAGDEIRSAIAKAGPILSQRVRGQSKALTAVCTALRKASVGLSGAQQSGSGKGPRAILFFAGPTGTGKTETAKAIAELVYGDESAMLRFDCAEFRQDHSVARLIGAPPGYVGFESGGELTDRIRTRPQSVVLFDEIEKAHPRLLDIFLSILDDGRLTNGQGVTSDFGECILIFTSNLGIYEETTDSKGRTVRRPRFGYEASFEDIQSSVRTAIREEFISTLGRPELLGRLGGEQALIVFDYLRDLQGVTEKFIANIGATVKRLHNIGLQVDPGIFQKIANQTATRPDALALGARGLGQVIEFTFKDPLADYIFVNETKDCQIKAQLEDDHVKFYCTNNER